MPSTLDPRTLYRGCHSGDRAESAEAYQQLGEFLLRVAFSRLRSKPELHPHAQECAQDALLTIWQQLEAGQGPDDPQRFLSWSASIVIHKVYDQLRRLGYTTASTDAGGEAAEAGPATRRTKRVPRAKQKSFEQYVAYNDGTTVPQAERMPDLLAVDPEANVLDREGLVELLWGVRNHSGLSDNSKEVLLLGFLAGLTDEELATRLNTKKSNIHVIRSRDLSRLRSDADFVARLRSYYS